MAQGEFTKDEANNTIHCVDRIFGALPKTKQRCLLGELNDVYLFLEKAKQVAPDATSPKA